MLGLISAFGEYECVDRGPGRMSVRAGSHRQHLHRDLVYLLEESGFDTGIDLDALTAVARRVERSSGVRCRSGDEGRPALRKYSLDDPRRAVG